MIIDQHAGSDHLSRQSTHLLHDTTEETSNPRAPRAGRDGTVGILDLRIQAGLWHGLLLLGGLGVARFLLIVGLLDVIVSDIHRGRSVSFDLFRTLGNVLLRYGVCNPSYGEVAFGLHEVDDMMSPASGCWERAIRQYALGHAGLLISAAGDPLKA